MGFRAFIVALVLVLAACVHRPVVHVPVAQEAPQLKTVRYSADSSLQLQLSDGHPYMRYELKESKTAKVLGRAESGTEVGDFSYDYDPGKKAVLFSADNRSICIVETTSDACPAKRYILLRKMPSGRYAARYLHPALDPDPTIGTFEGDYPAVIALTAESITFSRAVGSPHPKAIDSVPTFPTPQSAIY